MPSPLLDVGDALGRRNVGRWSGHRQTGPFRRAIYQMSFLAVPWSAAIDDYVLGIPRCRTEQVEYRDPVIRMRPNERVSRDVYLSELRDSCQARNLDRIGEPVVPQVQLFQGEQPVDARKGNKTVRAKGQGGDGGKRVATE